MFSREFSTNINENIINININKNFVNRTKNKMIQEKTFQKKKITNDINYWDFKYRKHC